MKKLSRNKIKILIAEDEAIIKMDLKRTLDNLGFLVKAVNSSEELIKVFQIENPDLIITDIHFNGELSGLEAAVMLNRIKPLPIIFISGYLSSAYKNSVESIRVCEFVNKPFDDGILEEKIKICMEQSSKQ